MCVTFVTPKPTRYRGCVKVSEIPIVIKVTPNYTVVTVTTDSQLLLADDHLVADFPYDPEQVKEIKNITGAKWDKVARVWRVPVASICELRAFAERHRFWIAPEVLRFDLPDTGLPAPGVRLADDTTISISFPYDPVLVQAIKQVPDISFSPRTKSWTAPISELAFVVEWASRFHLLVDDAVLTKSRLLADTQNELAESSRATDADIDLPDLAGELRPYQKAGIAYALKSRRCFIADEMGTGKTIQSLVALEAAEAFPAVVVCPATLTLNWEYEAKKWLPHRSVARIQNRKDAPEPADITIVGWSNLEHWAANLTDCRGYVFDESHYAKNPDAKRTKAAIKVAKTAPADGLVLCLTGTPVTNKPAEYASQLEILGRLKDFGGRWNFYKRYCAAFKDRFGVWHIDGSSHKEELNERLRATCYIRRTKDQVLTDLPPLLSSRVLISPDPKVMVRYRKAEDDIAQFMADRAAEIARELGTSPRSAAVLARIKAESSEHLVRMAALRQLAAEAKMAAVVEWVESFQAAGQKVVLAAHHREVVDALAERFGGLKIQGGMKIDEVEQAKAQFQNDPNASVIVLSIQAAKTGHTLTAAQDIGFVELPFTPADVDQTAARCHRIGQAGLVTSHFLLAAGTIDERIYDLIGSKRAVVDVVTDGAAAAPSLFDASAGGLVEYFTRRGLGLED